jgi:hypothetical protein
MNTELFCERSDHFIGTMKPSRDSLGLLILDSQYRHMRYLELFDRTGRSHVTIVCLPLHSTHKLQPVDKTFKATLKQRGSENIHVGNWKTCHTFWSDLTLWQRIS